MPKPYKLKSTRPLPPDAEIVQHEGRPHYRTKERGRAVLFKLTKDGTSYLKPSKCWYFDIRDANGTIRRTKGFADLKATEALAAETERKTSRVRVGIIDPTEEHLRRPLTDHLRDYAAYLEAKGNTAGHTQKTLSLLSALFTGAGFQFLQDIDAAKTADWLNTLRRDGKPVQLPAGVGGFTPKTVAELLGISKSALGKNLNRHQLTATGHGKARRIPRDAVESLVLAAARGIGPQQTNHYVRAAKAFTRWMTRTRRMTADPLETLNLLNTETDVRRQRRELTVDELQGLLTATKTSRRSFRGLSGEDRFALYLVAAGTGFRANALANLTPADFDLNADSPTVTLSARFAKNRKTKVQPLPYDVADAIREYLVGKPIGSPIWGGNWREKAADMLRIDLEAANIPYAIEGPDGPEYCDFHALRHTYLTMLGRNGVDLRTAQELAGHSTPLLTARYSHRRLYDLAGAVEKLPNLVPDTSPNRERETAEIPLRLTGTEGMKSDNPIRLGVVPGVVTGGIEGHRMAPMYTFGIVGEVSEGSPQPLEMKQPDTVRHQVASDGTEWAVAGLNRGPSDFQELAEPCANALESLQM